MENRLMYGNNIICTFQLDPSSVVPSGSRSCPTLRLWAEPATVHKISITGSSGRAEERHYSMVGHDLGLYLGKGKKEGGDLLTPVLLSGLPLRSWWTSFGTMEFLAPLDFFKLEAIERERRKDVVLVVSGTVTLAIHPDSIASRNSHLEQIDGYEEAQLDLIYNIAQSRWVEAVLSRLGHRKFYVLELDLTHCEISKALEYIMEAEAAAMEGRLVDSAIRCRDMMDYLTKQYLALDKKDVRSEKWARACSYLKKFASLSGHQEDWRAEVGAGFSFNRDDAEFTLITAKALIRYAQVLKKSGQ
jgi:hypothetical protein